MRLKGLRVPDAKDTEIGLYVLSHVRTILAASRAIGIKTHEVSDDETVLESIDAEVDRIADACIAISKKFSN